MKRIKKLPEHFYLSIPIQCAYVYWFSLYQEARLNQEFCHVVDWTDD